MRKFYAKGDLLVAHPLQRITYSGGQVKKYVGRRTIANSDGSASFVATEEGLEFDELKEPKLNKRLCDVVRKDGSLWPADRETAQACRVEWVPLEWLDGEWVPVKHKPKSDQSKLKKTSGN